MTTGQTWLTKCEEDVVFNEGHLSRMHYAAGKWLASLPGRHGAACNQAKAYTIRAIILVTTTMSRQARRYTAMLLVFVLVCSQIFAKRPSILCIGIQGLVLFTDHA